MSDLAFSVNTSRDFLTLLFGHCPPDLYVLIWRLAGKKSFWFRADQLKFAAEFAATQKDNIYFGAALSPEDFGPWNRCEADRAAAIVGLWTDIDIKGPAHKTAALPETMGQADELANSLDLPPTVRVDSGHGLQVYWLFNEPWILAHDAERKQAGQLVERFQAALRRNAEERGWKMDSTQDLARILRVPGTTNRKPKCEPVPVRLIGADGPRYDRHDLAARIPEIPDRRESKLKLQATAYLDDRAVALSALAGLNAGRADPYMGDGGWLDVGMAMHSVDSSASMLAEWDRWSRQSSHYEEGVCEMKWATFSAGGGITLGSLIHWARQDGWVHPAGEKAPSQAEALAGAKQLAAVLLHTIGNDPLLLATLQALTGKDRPSCA